MEPITRETYIESDVFADLYSQRSGTGIALPRIRQYGRRTRHTGVCRPVERSFREDSSEGRELIRIERLRRMAKHLGMEKVVKKRTNESLPGCQSGKSVLPERSSSTVCCILCSNIPGFLVTCVSRTANEHVIKMYHRGDCPVLIWRWFDYFYVRLRLKTFEHW